MMRVALGAICVPDLPIVCVFSKSWAPTRWSLFWGTSFLSRVLDLSIGKGEATNDKKGRRLSSLGGTLL